MLKKERLVTILNLVNQSGIITVNQLIEQLGVSDMTIRRDLADLENSNKLIRMHGGCQSLTYNMKNELAHNEKKSVFKKEKMEVAEIATSYIEEGDTIFLGTGTTIELFASYFDQNFIRIVTNSLPVFESLQERVDQYDVILLGGNYRKKTGAFVGSITNGVLEKMRFSKSFIGVNGINNDCISNSNSEEGSTQRLALNCAEKKYIVADLHKLNKSDFYCFYNLSDIDGLITNSNLDNELRQHYSNYTHVINQMYKKYIK